MAEADDPGRNKQPVAVALKYEHGKDPAPRVTAKGKGSVAEKIVETAKAHGVVVEPNAVLAEALSLVEVDQQIPEELYRAVAEVIVFVMRLSGPSPSPRKNA
jgi:flagellar biosynthesis protein